jgi:ankyrin repeat protein
MQDKPPSDTSLFAAAQTRDSTLAARLLAVGRERYAVSHHEPLKPEDIDAILDDELAGVEALLRSGRDPNSAISADFKDMNLLSVALARRNECVACMLMEHGADVRGLHDDEGGWKLPALHGAARQGLDDIVWLLLLDGADPNQLAQDRSALFLAAGLESPQIAAMLIHAGANVDLGLASETPLMAAAENGRTATVDLLLAHHANVNARTRSGWTALHHAAWSNHPGIARKLLDAGADPLAVDDEGRNATDHATGKFDPIYAEIFREWGIPDAYSPEPTDDAWQAPGDFEYFISYRHGKFAGQALNLAGALRAAGLAPFLDRELLDLPTSSPAAMALVKSRLVKALRRSRTTIFFESYRETSDAPGFSWQFFELLNSREALLVSVDGGWAGKWITTPGKRVSTSDTVFVFSSMEELSAILAARSWT